MLLLLFLLFAVALLHGDVVVSQIRADIVCALLHIAVVSIVTFVAAPLRVDVVAPLHVDVAAVVAIHALL